MSEATVDPPLPPALVGHSGRRSIAQRAALARPQSAAGATDSRGCPAAGRRKGIELYDS